ncbi:MAG: hypothetical protein V1748_02700 [Actinomycetota bacterium]
MSSGSPVANYPKIGESVCASVPDGSGGWFIGGSFDFAGGFTRNRLAHIEADGSVDTDWNPDANGTVHTLAISGSTVYAGGEFTTFKGGTVPRDYIAAIPTAGDGTPDGTWDPDANGTVHTLAVSDSTVYAGGEFTTFKGGTVPRDYVAAIPTAGDGTPDGTWDPDASSNVRALAISGSTVYAGGAFTTFKGGTVTRNHVAAMPTGGDGTPTTWNPDADSWVISLNISGSTVYMGGWFDEHIGGAKRLHLAAIDATTGNATAWNPGASSNVYTLSISGSTVFAGGDFGSIGAKERVGIAAVNPTTGEATSWDPGEGLAEVQAIAASGSTIYVGGPFTSMGGQTRNNIAAIDAATGEATSWNPNADNWVATIAVSGSTVYVGGVFTNIGGQARNGLAALDTATGNATSWNPNPTGGSVRALAISGATIYTGGYFTGVGGQARNRIAALDAATGNATSWNPNADAAVKDLEVSGSTVYAGGYFTGIGGQARSSLAALSTTTGNATAWNPNPTGGMVEAVEVSGSTIYAGGDFTNIGGQARNSLAGLSAATGDANTWNPAPEGPVLSLEAAGDALFVGGYFGEIGGGLRWCFAQFGYPPPTISSITPGSGEEGTTVNITSLKGTGFRAGAGVKLTRSGHATITASSVAVVSSTEITCRFNLAGAAVGVWNVLVSNVDGQSATKSSAFNVTQTPVTTYPDWYLAEGSTAWGYDCYISIENPNEDAVNAQVTYMTDTGPVDGGVVPLPALSQATVNPRDTLGDRDFSTQVTCQEDETIAVDRTMSWTGQGAASPEAHNSVGVTSPNDKWYLPEGSSQWGFECWLLIQNPNGAEATATITYMIEGAPSEQFEKKIPASSRATYNMEADIGRRDASIKVDSDIPVIPERAMYRNNRREGHDSIGTTAPALDYYLAEGTTAWGFTTYMLVQNPNESETEVSLTYMTSEGPVTDAPFTMPASSRKTIRVNDAHPNKDLSTRVTGSQPIIAERAMYWDNGTGEACHDSVGMASPHAAFYLPDGETSNGKETWTLVQNPNGEEVTVQISYLTPTGQGNVTKTEKVPSNSRSTFNMVEHSGINGRAAIMVVADESELPIMCERAMYWNSRGAGTDTIGGYSE